MFSFNGVSTPSSPLIIEADGTQGIFLKKAEYAHPEGKDPRIEFHLEKPTEGGTESQVITVNDYTIKGARYDKQPQQELDRLFGFLQAYNPTVKKEELVKQVGEQETWEDMCSKVFSLLPEGFDTVETSWFLKYNSGSDYLTIPNIGPFVKIGKHKFKSNPQYDFFTPQKKAVVPSGLDEFNTTANNELDEVFGSKEPSLF